MTDNPNTIQRLLSNVSPHVLLIIVVALIAYSNTFHVPFIFDDMLNIVDNPFVKDLTYYIHPATAKGLAQYVNFKTRYIGYLTFAFNYRLHGLDETGYHIFNLAVHICNALLVYQLVRLTFKTPDFVNRRQPETGRHGNLIALFSALLFVAHPIQTQAVTYVVQRFASLAALFCLLSLVAYIRARLAQLKAGSYLTVSSICNYLLVLLSAILAMNTKENAFTLPVIITLYEFVFLEGIRKSRVVLLLPIMLTMLIIPLNIIGIDMQAGKLLGDVDQATRLQTVLPRWDYLLTQFRVIVTYLRLLFFPINQNIDYDYPVHHSFINAEVISSFALLSLLLCAALYLLYRARHMKSDNNNGAILKLLAFGILWFFITLSVESSVFPIVDVMFEHRVYLPSVGFVIFIAASFYLIYKLSSPGHMGISKLIIALPVIIVILLLVAAFERNSVWRNEVSLWSDAVSKSPQKARPLTNLGFSYLTQTEPQKAEPLFQAALKMDPKFVTAWFGLGRVFSQNRQLNEAATMYQKAVELNPNYASGWIALAKTEEILANKNRAIECYTKAIRLTPNDISLYNNLNRLYIKSEMFHERKEFNP